MRIAQVSPLIESVPPKGYGGTERIVSYLTEGLVENGHSVTLFASADSRTKARLISICPQGLRLYKKGVDTLAYNFIQLEEVVKMSAEFDVIHFHNDYLHFPVSRNLNYAHVNTLHGRQDIPGLSLLYEKFNDMPLISISDYQRVPLPHAFWISTVYHGLPKNLYTAQTKPGKYLAFLGRISIEKRVDRAIEIARRTGIPLKIAAKVDPNDQKYFETKSDICWMILWWNTLEKSVKLKKVSSWVMLLRCFSPLTGLSPSDWS
jgi:glycosyltransferase involved in cell wall biosynthesis